MVDALDASNAVADGYLGTIHFTSTDTSAILPADYTFTALDEGGQQFSATLVTAGSREIRVADTTSALITGAQTAIIVNAGPAHHLNFAAQPSNTNALATISPAVTVRVEDAYGNLITGSVATVGLQVTGGTPALNGTTSVAAVGGIATFSNLSIGVRGTGYTLDASSAGLIGDTSNAFDIIGLAQTITFGPLANHTYGDAPFSVSATSTSGLTVTFSSLTAACSVAGSQVTILAAGTCTIRASQIGDSVYDPATPVDQSFNVNQATPVITWANPANITYGTALSATQLNATASVPGSFVYTPASGTVLNAGASQALGVAFTPTDSANYTNANATVHINVNQASQTITFGALANKTVPESPVSVSATASSSLTVIFSTTTPAVCTSGGLNGAQIALLAAGTCTVQADQFGNSNWSAASPVAQSFTVSLASTTTTITNAAALSSTATVVGQSYTVSVSVTSPYGTPTGIVNVFDGVSAGCALSLSGGVGSCSITLSSVGAKTITATFPGTAAYSISGAGPVSHTVNQAATTTAVTSSVNPSALAQSVTFTATVSITAPGGGLLGGTVQFKDGVTNLGSPVAISGNQAQYSTTSLTVGSHSITAVYSGNSNFIGSTSPALSQVVNPGSATHLSVSGHPSPSAANTAQSFVVIARDASNNIATGYTGTVHFTSSDGLAVLPSNYTFTVGDGGVRIFSATLKTAGTQSITATDTLTGTINGTQSGIVVTLPPTTTTVTGVNLGTPTVVGQAYTVSVSVTSGSGTPTGSVVVSDGVATCNVTLAAGTGSCSLTSTSVGVKTISATYAATVAYGGSVGTASHTVNKASTTTSVTSSVNPSLSGQSVTFTATVAVTAPGAGTRTGTVQFKDGASNLGSPVTVAGNQASFSTSALSVGGHSITAVYSGDTNFNGSTSGVLTQTVNGGLTVTGITPNTIGRGAVNKPVTVTGTGFAAGATLAITSGGAITISSVVRVNSTTITANVSVSNGASLTSRNVTVTNPGPSSATCVNCLTITAAPNISSLNPSSMGRGAVNENVVITGSNFLAGSWLPSNVLFSGSGITVNSVTRTNSTHLTVNLSISSVAATNNRDVTVVNLDGGRDTDNNAFDVDPAPVVSSLSPSSRGQGATSQSIVITGSNFLSGAWPNSSVTFSGTGITVNSVTRTNSTHLTVNISVSTSATVGARTVTVRNLDAGIGSLAGAFTVNARPTLTSLSPNARHRGQSNQTIIFTGTGFVTGITVAFSGSGVTVGSVTRNSSTQLTVVISVSGGAALGSRNVTVTNPDAGTFTLNNGFTVQL